MPDVEFDRNAVLAALKQATVTAWERMTSLDPPETIYGLMLYEGAEYGYVCVSAFTEEGLDRTVAEYRSGEWAHDYEGDDGREALRWSAQDSPHHVITEIGTPPLLSSDEIYRSDAPWIGDDEADERYKAGIRALCMQTLSELDDEGRFGDRRDTLTILIEDRDGMETAEECRDIIERLNPPAVVKRYDEFWEAIERERAREQE